MRKHTPCCYVGTNLNACTQPARWWIWLTVPGGAHVVVPLCTRHEKEAGRPALWRAQPDGLWEGR